MYTLRAYITLDTVIASLLFRRLAIGSASTSPVLTQWGVAWNFRIMTRTVKSSQKSRKKITKGNESEAAPRISVQKEKKLAKVGLGSVHESNGNKVEEANTSKRRSARVGASEAEGNGPAPGESTAKSKQPVRGTKRKLEAVKIEDDGGELPRGLGEAMQQRPDKKAMKKDTAKDASSETVGGSERKSKSINAKAKPAPAAKKVTKGESNKEALSDTKTEEASPAKKVKKSSSEPVTPAHASAKKPKSKAAKSYGLTPGTSPFPNYPRPTAADCHEVHTALASLHGECAPPKTIPVPSEVVAGCGEVPAVLDAMIRTYLSSNTTGRNSSAAFQGLVKSFGTLKSGIGKGSVDWNAVRLAPQEEVFEAIKHGGLGGVKSKTIKAILDAVYEENTQRRQAMDDPSATDPSGTDPDSKDASAEKDLERLRLDQNVLSLDHYHNLPTAEAQSALTKFPGIGVKTSSCVLLFCMQRPSFAVDTHVFRLASWLGWIPDSNAPRQKGEKKVDRDTAFSHLDVRIPDELKYGLHYLFVKHGKTCPRCRAITGEGSEGWEGANCPIEGLVKRTGAVFIHI